MELFQEYLGGGGKKQQKIFGSSLEDIKQKAIKAGINPVNLQQAQQFQDGSWTPFAQGTTATYKGSEGIAEQSFTGTKQEITQQATDAGINPSNLFSGIDKFVPEADDNIDISQGEASVLQGSQSGWFKKFQNAYVSGQATLQNSIDMAMNRLMEITEEEKQARESQISDIKGDLDEAKASSSGQELYYNLAEKEDLKGKRDELLKLKNKMAMLNNAYEESIMETEGSGITIGQSRGELARKQRSYASRATMIQAQASMLSDDLDTSMELIKLWYDDATEERVAEISRYSDLLDVAEKAKLNLSNQDRTDVANLISTLTGEQAKQDDNKDKIMALAVDPNTAEAFFSSGASLDDTYEQILEKMSPYMSAYAKAERLAALEEDIPDTIDNAGEHFTDTQIAKGAIKAGISIEDFKLLPIDTANEFIFGERIPERDVTLVAEDLVAGLFEKIWYRGGEAELRIAKEKAIKMVRDESDREGNIIMNKIKYNAEAIISNFDAITDWEEILKIKEELK